MRDTFLCAPCSSSCDSSTRSIRDESFKMFPDLPSSPPCSHPLGMDLRRPPNASSQRAARPPYPIEPVSVRISSSREFRAWISIGRSSYAPFAACPLIPVNFIQISSIFLFLPPPPCFLCESFKVTRRDKKPARQEAVLFFKGTEFIFIVTRRVFVFFQRVFKFLREFKKRNLAF